jgi:predicted TIM-barrel fold metal-dependent hydrolase
MMVIAIEEHFWSPGLRDRHPTPLQAFFRQLTRGERLAELGERRIADMDDAGIDLQVLSEFAPGAQDADPDSSVALARASNDHLFSAVRHYPERLAGFATLPTPSPESAADELQRCVEELGFKGAMINGYTNNTYLDAPQYHVILARAEALDVPIYLHPRSPHPQVMAAYFDGYFSLSQAAWGYAVETGTHAFRLILSGVFDKFPLLKVVLGHMGENIPYCLTRFQNAVDRHEAIARNPSYIALRRPVADYFLNNFYITTSGAFDPHALRCAISVLGIDRILFATDYPVEDAVAATAFLRSAPLTDEERAKIAHRNAKLLLRL